MSKWKSQ